MNDEIKKSLFKIAEKTANQDDVYFDGHASTELSKLLHNTLALINRQQAEIERLKKAFEQVKWERDTAIEQLESYGVGFCEEKELVEVKRSKLNRADMRGEEK